MDVVAHALWAGVGMTAARRRYAFSPLTLVAAVALAVLPDVVQFLPLLAWVGLGDGTWQALRDWALAAPGREPALPPWVALLSHHLHCTLHSALVAGAVTFVAWRARGAAWLWPLAGWWSHIVIDVFTHSAAYYPAPVLYPITQRGFDGLAWNTPWALAVNYAALAVALGWLVASRRRGTRPRGPGAAAPP